MARTTRLPTDSPAPIAGIRVVRAGALSTVQDGGRAGALGHGFARAGALDPLALAVGNRLVGNAPTDAALEMTLRGDCLESLTDLVIALCGADLDTTLDGVPLPLWTALRWPRGGRLNCGVARHGVRGYLCVAGGLRTPFTLGSRSTDLLARIGGAQGRPLRAGDLLPVAETAAVDGLALTEQAADMFAALPLGGEPLDGGQRPPTRVLPIAVIMGPQAHLFSAAARAQFLATAYTVSQQSDRTGMRLLGPPLPLAHSTDILSEGVPLGGIQIANDGRPLLLLADSRGMGGYAKIATVARVHLHRLAQARVGQRVRFRVVDVATAQAALRAQHLWLSMAPYRRSPALTVHCMQDDAACPHSLDCLLARRCAESVALAR